MRIKGGLCQHVYCEKKERAEAGSSGSARKAHWRSFACSCQKWATIIRCLKILFLSLGRRCFHQLSKGFDKWVYHKKNKIKSKQYSFL